MILKDKRTKDYKSKKEIITMMKKITYKITAAFAALALTVGAFGFNALAANTKITADQAKEIAVKRAGVPGARYTKVKLDYEHGRYEYEIEFLYNGYEYDVEVDANTGHILDFDVEYDD